MSTKEILYSIIDEMTEQQMQELIVIINEKKEEKKVRAEDVMGILAEYADPDLVPLEDSAWERAVIEKYGNSGH